MSQALSTDSLTKMLIDCWWNVNRGVNGVLIEFRLKLWIEDNDRHSTTDAYINII